MLLYHFATSPYARRVRLALAHKGVTAELRDVRANPALLPELHRLNPMRTVPVLVDGERVVADSTVILHYLDRKLPDPPLWPAGMDGADAFELVILADSAVDVLVNLGQRYAPLHDHEGFPELRSQLVGRAQRTLERLAEKVAARYAGSGAPLFGRWSGADMAVYAAVAWLDGLPGRAATSPPAKRILDLGWTVPPTLLAWARDQRARDDVAALDAT